MKRYCVSPKNRNEIKRITILLGGQGLGVWEWDPRAKMGNVHMLKINPTSLLINQTGNMMTLTCFILLLPVITGVAFMWKLQIEI